MKRFKFPILREPKRVVKDCKHCYIDKYWLQDEMQRLKDYFRERISKIDDFDYLFELKYNRLDHFLDKVYDKYYYINPDDKNPIYTYLDFSEDIKVIESLIEERLAFLAEQAKAA